MGRDFLARRLRLLEESEAFDDSFEANELGWIGTALVVGRGVFEVTVLGVKVVIRAGAACYEQVAEQSQLKRRVGKG